MGGIRRGLRPWSANSMENSYHRLGPSKVRNLPRVTQQQVSGRIWVRIQVSQSCPCYMLATVLSGSHRVSANPRIPESPWYRWVIVPRGYFLSQHRWRWKWEELAELGACCPQPHCREGEPPSPKRHPLSASDQSPLLDSCAKSLQLCPTPCTPMDCNLPGSSVIPSHKVSFTEMASLPGFHLGWNLPEVARCSSELLLLMQKVCRGRGNWKRLGLPRDAHTNRRKAEKVDTIWHHLYVES